MTETIIGSIDHGGLAARCEVCRALHWCYSGWARYEGRRLVGWAIYGPQFGKCARGCPSPKGWSYSSCGGPLTADLVPCRWNEQMALLSIYKLGGHVAIAEIINDELPALTRRAGKKITSAVISRMKRS